VRPVPGGSTCGRSSGNLTIYLYEAYKDPAAFECHKKHDPYKKWKEMVDKTMEQVTEIIPFTESVATNVDE
jgi:quinol monooxygenase YgiN